MKTTFRKLSTVLLALIMIFAMSISTFAVNTDGTVNDDKGIESTDNTIGIAKQIVFVNGESTTVREPNITYTYSITAASPENATITDKDNMSGTVKSGVIGAVSSTTATVSFADTNTVNATSNGTNSASKYASFTFTPATFGAAGIYRYKISETTDVTKASVGITEAATYSADRYLDVYVQKNANSGALEIYGYVLYDGDANESFKSTKLDPAGDVSKKSAGYVDTDTNPDDTTHSNVDVYTTQNLFIDKTTTGTMADVENDFPVALTFTAASGVTATPKIDVVLAGNGALTGTASDAVGTYIAFATSMSGTVRGGSSIYLKGIPEGAKASLVETNNTSDSYKVKAGATAGAEDLLTEAIVAAGADSGATTAQTLEAKKEIYITNTLNAISPTNVVMRFAPYLFILGGAVMLLIVSRRRRSEEE